jgi:hypothetical protein
VKTKGVEWIIKLQGTYRDQWTFFIVIHRQKVVTVSSPVSNVDSFMCLEYGVFHA